MCISNHEGIIHINIYDYIISVGNNYNTSTAL